MTDRDAKHPTGPLSRQPDGTLTAVYDQRINGLHPSEIRVGVSARVHTHDHTADFLKENMQQDLNPAIVSVTISGLVDDGTYLKCQEIYEAREPVEIAGQPDFLLASISVNAKKGTFKATFKIEKSKNGEAGDE